MWNLIGKLALLGTGYYVCRRIDEKKRREKNRERLDTYFREKEEQFHNVFKKGMVVLGDMKDALSRFGDEMRQDVDDDTPDKNVPGNDPIWFEDVYSPFNGLSGDDPPSNIIELHPKDDKE